MTHPNAMVIERFYRAFDAGDGEAMAEKKRPRFRGRLAF